jgi:hypothetical protein
MERDGDEIEKEKEKRRKRGNRERRRTRVLNIGCETGGEGARGVEGPKAK